MTPCAELIEAARVYARVVEERYAGRTGWASVAEARSLLLSALDIAERATLAEADLRGLAEWPCQRFNPPHDCGPPKSSPPLPCGPCVARAALASMRE